MRAYHGDFIKEKVFKRWFLPETLPDVRPKRKVLGDDKASLEEFALRKKKEKELAEEEAIKGMAPVGSLMFSEVERRIDIFLFRCCFVHSVYEARRLIIHGNVKLNGKKVCVHFKQVSCYRLTLCSTKTQIRGWHPATWSL